MTFWNPDAWFFHSRNKLEIGNLPINWSMFIYLPVLNIAHSIECFLYFPTPWVKSFANKSIYLPERLWSWDFFMVNFSSYMYCGLWKEDFGLMHTHKVSEVRIEIILIALMISYWHFAWNIQIALLIFLFKLILCYVSSLCLNY